MPSNLSKLDPNDLALHTGNVTIQPRSVVRDLGVYFDSNITTRDHISRTTRNCFYQLRRLRPIRRLASALDLSRLPN